PAPTSVLVSQHAGDRNPDLVVTDGGSDSVRILAGQGQGRFDDGNPRVLSTGAAPQQEVIADFTGDGHLDLVTVNSGSDDLTFVPNFLAPGAVGREIPSGGHSPVAALAADVNGDGVSDLVVANNGDGH